MDFTFKFYKNRANVEKFRINIRDPINGNKAEDSNSLSKVELIIGNTILSTENGGGITWDSDVIQINPSSEQLAALPNKAHSELVAYKGINPTRIAIGYTMVID